MIAVVRSEREQLNWDIATKVFSRKVCDMPMAQDGGACSLTIVAQPGAVTVLGSASKPLTRSDVSQLTAILTEAADWAFRDPT